MSWKHIRGHDALIEGFARVEAKHRLAHAYLFVGPPGVGKKLFATELAKTLLCEARGDRFEACDTCEACVLFQAGTHPDFFTFAKLEEKDEFSREVMTEVCETVVLKPARGQGRIAILDDADYLNPKTANMFLKTLEEPPARSRFVLLGTSLEQQMPTIQSRCQVVRFQPLPAAVLTEILIREGVPGEMQPRLIHLAGGSPGLALDLRDQELWDIRKLLLDGLFRDKVDFAHLANKWTEYNENAGKETAKHRLRARLVLRLLIDFFGQGLAAASESGDTSALRSRVAANPDDGGDRQILNRLTNRLGSDGILEFLERLLEAEEQLDRYIQVTLVLEGLLDHWAQRWEVRPLARA